jgi:hypothetical protein
MVEVPINYWAVLAAGVVNMVLGALWFGPLFGKAWMNAQGWDAAKIEEIKKAGKGMRMSYVLMAVGSLIMAFTLAHALVFASTYLQVSGIQAGLTAGFWNWFGFMMPVTIGVVLWDDKSWMYWFITYSYNLAAMLLMGVILALW